MALFGDPAVAAWIWPPERDDSGPRTPEQANALIDRFLGHWAEHGFGMWYWTERESGDFVGQVGLQHTDVEGETGPTVEIGWTLVPAAWGKGYATEAPQPFCPAPSTCLASTRSSRSRLLRTSAPATS